MLVTVISRSLPSLCVSGNYHSGPRTSSVLAVDAYVSVHVGMVLAVKIWPAVSCCTCRA